MSKIYKKEIITTQLIDFIRCNKCDYETAAYNIIDSWAIVNDEYYCLKCQKKYNFGYYEKRK